MLWLTICLSFPGSTQVASIKAPSRLLAALARNGSTRASPTTVVAPGPILDMAELAHTQDIC